MPNREKQRERQRANRRKKYKEEALDRKTVGGVSDLTPFQAIENIRRNDIDRTS